MSQHEIIPPPPPPQGAKVLPHDQTPQLSCHGDITVLTWNILAQCYLFPHRLDYLPHEYNDFQQSRLVRFLNIIQNSQADILCLQEVDQIEHIQQGLTALGYDMVYRQRGTYVQKLLPQAPSTFENDDQESNSQANTSKEIVDSSLQEQGQLEQQQQQKQKQDQHNQFVDADKYNDHNDYNNNNSNNVDVKKKPVRGNKNQSKKQRNSLVQFNTTTMYTAVPHRIELFKRFVDYLQNSSLDSTVLFSHILTDTARKYNKSIQSFLPFPSSSPHQHQSPVEEQQQLPNSSTLPINSGHNPIREFESKEEAFENRLDSPVDFSSLFEYHEIKNALDFDLSKVTPTNFRCHPLLSGIIQHRPKQDGLLIAWKSDKFELSMLPIEVDLNILGYSTTYATPNNPSVLVPGLTSVYSTGTTQGPSKNFMTQLEGLSLQSSNIDPQKRKKNTQPHSTPSSFADLTQVNVNSRLLRDNVALFVALNPIDTRVGTGRIVKDQTVLIGNSYFFFNPVFEDVKVVQSLFTTRIINQLQKYITDKTIKDNNEIDVKPNITTIFCGDFNSTPSSSAVRVIFGDILTSVDSIDSSHPEHDNLLSASEKRLNQTPDEQKEEKQKRFLKLKEKKLLEQLATNSDKTNNNSNPTRDKETFNNSTHPGVSQGPSSDTTPCSLNLNPDFPPPSNSATRGKLSTVPVSTLNGEGEVIMEDLTIPKITDGQDIGNIALDLRLSLERGKMALQYQVEHDNFIRSLVIDRQPKNIPQSQLKREVNDNATQQLSQYNITIPLVWEYYLKYNHDRTKIPNTPTICTLSCPHHTNDSAFITLNSNSPIPLPCTLPTPPITLVGDMIALARTMRGLGIDTAQVLIQPTAGFFPRPVHSLHPHIQYALAQERLAELKSSGLLPDAVAAHEIKELMDLTSTEPPFTGNVHFKISETDIHKAPNAFHQIIQFSHLKKRIVVTASNALLLYWESLLIDNADDDKFDQNNPYLAPLEHRFKYNIDQLPLIVYLPPVQSSYFGENDIEHYYLKQFINVRQCLVNREKTMNAFDRLYIPKIPSSLPFVPPEFARLHGIHVNKYGRPTTNHLNDLITPISPEDPPDENEIPCQEQETTLLTIFDPQVNSHPIKSLYSRLLAVHSAITQLEQVGEVARNTTIFTPKTDPLTDSQQKGVAIRRNKAASNTGRAVPPPDSLDLPRCNRQNIRFSALIGIIQGGLALENMLTMCTQCNAYISPKNRGCAKENHCFDLKNGQTIQSSTDQCEELRCSDCVEFFVGSFARAFPAFIKLGYNPSNTSKIAILNTLLYRRVIKQTIDQTSLLTLPLIDKYFIGKYHKQATLQYEYKYDISFSLHNLNLEHFQEQSNFPPLPSTPEPPTDSLPPPLHYNLNRMALYIQAHREPNNGAITPASPNTSSSTTTLSDIVIDSISTRIVMLQWFVGSLGPTALLISHLDYLSRSLVTNRANVSFSVQTDKSFIALDETEKEYRHDFITVNQPSDVVDDSITPQYATTELEDRYNGLIKELSTQFENIGVSNQSTLQSHQTSNHLNHHLKITAQDDLLETNPKLRLAEKKEWKRQQKALKNNDLQNNGHTTPLPPLLKKEQSTVSLSQSPFCDEVTDDSTTITQQNKKSYFIRKKFSDDDENDDDNDDNGDEEEGDDESFDIYIPAPPLPPGPTATKLYVYDGLHKLAKTLRAIGVDTAYGFPAEMMKATMSQKIQAVFDICRQEERVLVTNSRDILQRRGCPPYILLPSVLPQGIEIKSVVTPLDLPPQLNKGGELSYKPTLDSQCTGSPSYIDPEHTHSRGNNGQQQGQKLRYDNDINHDDAVFLQDNLRADDEATQSTVCWGYQIGQGARGFVKMDDPSNTKLEAMYQQWITNDRDVKYSKLWINPTPTRAYSIDFSTMTQKNAKTDNHRPIVRIDQYTLATGSKNPSLNVDNDQSTTTFKTSDGKKLIMHDSMQQVANTTISISDYHLYLIKTHLGFQFTPSAMYIRCTICNGTFKSLSIADVRGLSFIPSSIKAGKNKKDKKRLEFYQCETCYQVYWWGSKSVAVKNRLSSLLDGTNTLTVKQSLGSEGSLTPQSSLVSMDQCTANNYNNGDNGNNNSTMIKPLGFDGTEDDYNIIIPSKEVAFDRGIDQTTPDINQINGSWDCVIRAGRCIAVALMPPPEPELPRPVPPVDGERIEPRAKRPPIKAIKTVEVIYQGGSILSSLQHPLLFGLFITPGCIAANASNPLSPPDPSDPLFNGTNSVGKGANGGIGVVTGVTSYQDMISAKIMAKSELSFISAFAFNRHDMASLLQPLELNNDKDDENGDDDDDMITKSNKLLAKISSQYKHSLLNPVMTNAVKGYQGCLDYICIASTSTGNFHGLSSPGPSGLTNRYNNFSFKWAASLTSCSNGSLNSQHLPSSLPCPCSSNVKYQVAYLKSQHNLKGGDSNNSMMDTIYENVVSLSSPSSSVCGDMGFSIRSNVPTDDGEETSAPSQQQQQQQQFHGNIISAIPTLSLELEIPTTPSTPSTPLPQATPLTPSKGDLIPTLIMSHSDVVICPIAMKLFFNNLEEYQQFTPLINSISHQKADYLLSLVNSFDHGDDLSQETKHNLIGQEDIVAPYTHPPYPNRLNPSDHCPIVASFDIGL